MNAESPSRGGWWKWDQIAELIADAKEEAWEEGFDEGSDDIFGLRANNPYSKEQQ